MDSLPNGEHAKAMPPFISFRNKRFRVVLMVALSFFAQGMIRSSVSMAMVCMVNSTVVVPAAADDVLWANPTSCGNEAMDGGNEYGGSYMWTQSEQRDIFASFGWGSLASVFLSAWFGSMFGPSNVMLFIGVVNVVGSLLTPLAADFGVPYMILVRAIMGFAQGVQYPLGSTIVGAWLPLEDKSMASAIYTNGNQISYVISMLFSSQLCQATAIGGWRSIFYLYGAAGAVVCVLWWWVITDTPHDSADISVAELKHIVGNAKEKLPAVSTPWLKMFSSPVVLTLVFCTFGNQMVVNLYNTYLPLYFKSVLFMNLTSNGIGSALPFVCQTTMKFVVGAIFDWLKMRFPKRVEVLTKASQAICTFGVGICLLCIFFVGCGEYALAVGLLSLSMCFMAFNIGGHLTSVICVAPLHTSSLNTLTNAFGQVAVVSVPYIVKGITKQQTSEEWMIVFCINAAIMMAGGIAFIFFGTMRPIKWSRITDENIEKYSNAQRSSSN